VFSINHTRHIPKTKWKEFKQHMRQLAGQQNEETIKLSVVQDMLNEELFNVKVSFQDKESMLLFLKLENCAIISGSFRTLGMLREKNLIECSEINE